VNIALLISAMAAGGAERVASTLCNGWAERGDSVTLIATFSGKGEHFYPLSPGVQLVFLSDLAKTIGRSPRAYWRRFWSLRRLLRDLKPDVIVSFLSNVNVAAIAVSRGCGIPVIVCERIDPLAENESSRFLRLLRRITYPLAELVIVQTRDIVQPLRSCCPEVSRIEVVPNPLPPDVAGFTPKLEENGSRKRLISMGRFTRQKQFSLLIEVFSRLAGDHPEWDLWIWGDGPLREELTRQIANLRLNSRVFLPGKTSQPWLEFARAQAFVLTSAFEGFPNALLEAMAIGLPSIAFDCPSGPREITQDGKDALLVRAGDTAGLATALRRIMTDPALRQELSRRGSISVRERYDLNKVLATWDRIFELVKLRTLAYLRTRNARPAS
jgi:GalNAc-alpha-(1->4)-GalNAc-alpha-(1->3)-diNAcBac-PP-undecaprenol alpha-1,4-N-acetyl-D-galactosaminyltransferase